MKNARSFLSFAGAVILFVLLFAGLNWGNRQLTSQGLAGKDFFPRWMGTRLFLLKGQSPYSQATTRQVQRTIYGRLARAGEEQGNFLYPLYAFPIFTLFAMIPDDTSALATWMTVLELAVLIMIPVSIATNRWKPARWLWVLIVLFSAFWYYAVWGVVDGDPAILCAFFISLAFFAIRTEHDAWAGVLLTLASIKPQMVILLVIFTLMWAISRQRWQLFWAYLGSLGLLIAAVSLLQPRWIWDNLIQIVDARNYLLPATPGAILADWMPGIGRQLGWVITVFMLGILFWEWRAAMGKDFRWYFWTASLTLVITTLVGIRTATENYLAFYPGLILVLATWDERWGGLGRGLIIGSLLLLFAGIWWLFWTMIEPGAITPQHSLLFFPLPIYMLIGLYWTRWWAIRPIRLYVEELAVKVG